MENTAIKFDTNYLRHPAHVLKVADCHDRSMRLVRNKGSRVHSVPLAELTHPLVRATAHIDTVDCDGEPVWIASIHHADGDYHEIAPQRSWMEMHRKLKDYAHRNSLRIDCAFKHGTEKYAYLYSATDFTEEIA